MDILAKLPSRSGGRCGGIALLASALLLCSLPAGAASPVEREYENAAQSFRAGHLSAAFQQFMDLANRGDVDSARIALFMNSYGPALYGKQWDASPQNVAYWTMLVRNSGSSALPAPQIQPAALAPGTAKPRTAAARSRQSGLADVMRD